MYEKTVINGDSITENVAIKEKVSQKDVDEISSTNLGSDEWLKKMESLKSEGAAQVTTIENANKLYETLNKDNTRANLDAAIAATNKIKNSSSKKSLQDKIAPISKKIEKREKVTMKKNNEWDSNNNGDLDQPIELIPDQPETPSTPQVPSKPANPNNEWDENNDGELDQPIELVP